MKIGIISDSHDNLPALRRAVAHFKHIRVDALLHAGDFVAPFAAKLIAADQLGGIPLHCVYGNNDGEKAGLKKVLPQVVDGPLRLELGGRVLVMHHFIDWIPAAQLKGADVVVTGHTHEIVNARGSGSGATPGGPHTLFLNPGECGGWLTDRCTVMLLDTETLEAQVIEVNA